MCLSVEMLDNCVLVWLVFVQNVGRERKKREIVKISCYMPKTSDELIPISHLTLL